VYGVAKGVCDPNAVLPSARDCIKNPTADPFYVEMDQIARFRPYNCLAQDDGDGGESDDEEADLDSKHKVATIASAER
jgi:hypothetical protein